MSSGAIAYATQTFGVTSAELRKLYHDPVEMLSRVIQPTLWLLIFGKVMAHVRGLSEGGIDYLDFLAPGILAQSVLFAAIFYGIAAIWERDLGVLNRYMVSPAPRTALVIGKALSASVRGLIQAAMVYAIAEAIGIKLSSNPVHVFGVIVVIAIGSALFSIFSLIIACLVRTRERFMGIGQVLTMPIFFASNAIYPIDLMPTWLQVVSHLNPLTYVVDALRALMLRDAPATVGIGIDLLVLFVATTVLIAVAARLYPRLTQ